MNINIHNIEKITSQERRLEENGAYVVTWTIKTDEGTHDITFFSNVRDNLAIGDIIVYEECPQIDHCKENFMENYEPEHDEGHD